MTCSQHPDTPATGYCQHCGRPMCGPCTRVVGNAVYCEPCLAARLGIPVEGQPVPDPALSDRHAKPVLAAFLGLIPGVGAMYNGQFVKALAHVFVFAIFVHLSDANDVFGIFLAAWIFYQIFDAYQTARARRDGLALPNPFGLNDLGARLGLHRAAPVAQHQTGFGIDTPAAGAVPNAGTVGGADAASSFSAQSAAGDAGPGAGPDAGSAAAAAAGPSAYLAPYGETAGTALPAREVHGGEPVGAILLIVIGLFLLGETLGLFRWWWIGRCWPLVIVGIGVWLLVKRLREMRRAGYGGGSQ